MDKYCLQNVRHDASETVTASLHSETVIIYRIIFMNGVLLHVCKLQIFLFPVLFSINCTTPSLNSWNYFQRFPTICISLSVNVFIVIKEYETLTIDYFFNF